MLTKQFWSCKGTKVQNWEVWGMIWAWFGVWFRDPFLLNSGNFVAWVFFPTVNLPRLLLNGCNGSTCQATLDRTWIWRMWRSKYTSMSYIRQPAGVSSGCSSDVPLATVLLRRKFGLAASQPASQPASHSRSHPPHQPHQPHQTRQQARQVYYLALTVASHSQDAVEPAT